MNRVLIPDTKISILRCPDDAKKIPRERIADYREFFPLSEGIYRAEYNRSAAWTLLTVSLALTDT
jgi:hypothetical protein